MADGLFLYHLKDVVSTAIDRFCSLVVRVPATDPEVPGSIPGAIRFSEK
jgi:hypothetical protein